MLNPGGGEGIYGKVSFKNHAVGIIPLDEKGYTVLVGQYRYTLNEYSWEIPMGGGSLDEKPSETARRELSEETGLSAERYDLLMKIHTSNSVTDEVGYVYVAKGLSQHKMNLDESEQDIQLRRVSLEEAVQMVMVGEITDSISVAGLLKLARLSNLG